MTVLDVKRGERDNEAEMQAAIETKKSLNKKKKERSGTRQEMVDNLSSINFDTHHNK